MGNVNVSCHFASKEEIQQCHRMKNKTKSVTKFSARSSKVIADPKMKTWSAFTHDIFEHEMRISKLLFSIQ